MTDMSNHIFPRPCPDPTNMRALAAAAILMHPGSAPERDLREAFYDLRNAFHGDAVAAGWHHNIATGERKDRDLGEMLMLAVSEVAEAMEGHRKKLQDDKLPHRAMIEVELADFVIRCFDTIALPIFGGLETWARVYARDYGDHPANTGHRLLRIVGYIVSADRYVSTQNNDAARSEIMCAIFAAFRLAAALGLDLPGALVEKRTYNRTREDHSLTARLKDGGKAY